MQRFSCPQGSYNYERHCWGCLAAGVHNPPRASDSNTKSKKNGLYNKIVLFYAILFAQVKKVY